MSATQPPDPIVPDAVVAGDNVSPDTVAAPRVRGQRRIKAEHVRDYGIIVFAVALFIYFAVASSVFLTVVEGAGYVSDGVVEHPVSRGTILAIAPAEPHGMRAEAERLVIAALITPRPGSR